MESLIRFFLTATIIAMVDRHQTKPYPLRMQDELRVQLDRAAKANNRSLNAEIVARLERSISDSPVITKEEFPDLFEYALRRYFKELIEDGTIRVEFQPDDSSESD